MATAGVAISKSFQSSGLLLQRSSPASSCRVQTARQCVALGLSNEALGFSHACNLAGSVSFLSGYSNPNRVPARLSRAKRGKGSTRADSGGIQEGVQLQAARSSDIPGSPAPLERIGKRDVGPAFAAISVGGPQQEPEAVVTDPDGILDPEDMEMWLSEMEIVDSQDGASVSFSRADRIQKRADAAVLLEPHPAWQAGPRKFIASVRKALPPSIGDSPQGLTGLGAGVLLLILALLWALFRKKEEPQQIAQNAGFGNSPPGTGPSGVVKSGDRYSAIKSGKDDVSYKLGGAAQKVENAAQKTGTVAREVTEEAAKKTQDSLADLRKKLEHVKQSDNKVEASAKEVKGALKEGSQNMQWWVQKGKEKAQESTGRSGTGDSTLKPSGESKSEPVKGGARVEGSVGRSGTGESLKPSSEEGEGLGRMTPRPASVAALGSMLQDKGDSGSNGEVRSGSNEGVSRTVTSGVKGAPVKNNEQLVKSDVGEPGDKTPLPERKPRSEGDSSTHGGASKTEVGGVKGAPTKENEQPINSAVEKKPEKKPRSEGDSSTRGGASKTVTSGVKGAPVKQNEQLVKSDVGEPGDKTLLPERKPRSEGDSSTHGGASKTVVSEVKGAPVKENEQLVKSAVGKPSNKTPLPAVGDPAEKLSAKPLPERKEPTTKDSGSVSSFAGEAKSDGRGVEGSDQQELESLVKASVGKPSSDDAEPDSTNGKPDTTGSKDSPSPFQANTADSVLSARGVTDTPADRADVTAPKTPFQFNAADSVLSRAPTPQKPGQSELAAEVADLSAVLGQAGKSPNPGGQGLKGAAPGATEEADDVATLVSELSQVLNENKEGAASGKAGASTPPKKGSLSYALPSKPADATLPESPAKPSNVGSQTPTRPLGGDVRSSGDHISSAPAKPLGGKVQSAADVEASAPAKPLGGEVKSAAGAKSSGPARPLSGKVQPAADAKTSAPAKPVGGKVQSAADTKASAPAKPLGGNVQNPAGAKSSTPTKPLGSPDISSWWTPKPPVGSSSGLNPAKPSEVVSQTPTDSAVSGIDKLTPPSRSELIGKTPTVLLGATQNPAKSSEVISKTPAKFAGQATSGVQARPSETPGPGPKAGGVSGSSKDKTAGQAPPPIVSEAAGNDVVALPTEGWEPGTDSSALVDVDSGALVEVDSSALAKVDRSALVERESDADGAQEILEKIFVEDLPLPSPTKSKTSPFDRAQIIAKVQNVLPALAVSVGAAGALTGGVDGALETVGFAALASFASSKLLWANSREELKKELTDIKSSKDLVEFLKEKDLTPDC